jgi:hypothetical protein
VIAHNPHHHPAAPSSLALACRIAERAAANCMGRKFRPKVEWRGVRYLRCLGCRAWLPEAVFAHTNLGIDNRRSRCNPCLHKMASTRTGPRPLIRCSRKPKCKAKLRLNMARKRTRPTAPLPKVVNPTVVVALPSSSYTAPKPSTRQVEYVPDAPAPHPTVARVIVTDGSNPARAGMDAAAFAVAQERGRFDKARQYNPALTWEGWITVAGKKRGRPPRRDSGKVKGVGL